MTQAGRRGGARGRTHESSQERSPLFFALSRARVWTGAAAAGNETPDAGQPEALARVSLVQVSPDSRWAPIFFFNYLRVTGPGVWPGPGGGGSWERDTGRRPGCGPGRGGGSWERDTVTVIGRRRLCRGGSCSPGRSASPAGPDSDSEAQRAALGLGPGVGT